MIAAPVQCDVDGIPKGSHYVRVPPWERLAIMSFTAAALRFFKDLKRHNNKPWLEAQKEEY
jgi:hypothetical protein